MSLEPRSMSVIVTIPIALYRILELRCSTTSPEFNLLKNGVLNEERAVIRCAREAAAALREWAETCHRGAAAQISIDPDPEPER